MSFSKDSNIIIVGSGAFGLTSALHLVENGYKNITIYDRLDLHDLSYSFENGADTASADINKVFRAYYDDRHYYHKLALKAKPFFEAWDKELKQLNVEEAKAKFNINPDNGLLRIFENTGLIRLDNTTELWKEELDNLESFTKSGLRDTQFNINDPNDIERAKNTGWFEKFDAFGLSKSPYIEHLSGVLDSTSGLIFASNALLYVYYQLKSKGVKFVTGEPKGKLKSLILEEDVVKGIITEDDVKHEADLTILAAGPWTGSILPELSGLSEAHTGNVVLIKIPDSRKDLIEKYSKIPIINWRTGENKEKAKFSGFGIFPLTNGYVKLIIRQRKYGNPIKLPNGEIVSVPLTTRSDPPESRLTKVIIDQIKDAIRVFLPDLAEFGISKTQLLWYTDTINNDFIIDRVPNKENLIVVTGGSGHGFKFLPVLGKFVVDLIEDREDEEYRPHFKWRDPKDYNDINKIGEIKLGTSSYYVQELAKPEDLQFTKEDLSKSIDV